MTCAAQERGPAALKAENPAYGPTFVFYRVDWNLSAKDTLAKDLRIPRRSTLVLLKGRKELGRIAAGTSKADIQALLD